MIANEAPRNQTKNDNARVGLICERWQRGFFVAFILFGGPDSVNLSSTCVRKCYYPDSQIEESNSRLFPRLIEERWSFKRKFSSPNPAVAGDDNRRAARGNRFYRLHHFVRIVLVKIRGDFVE